MEEIYHGGRDSRFAVAFAEELEAEVRPLPERGAGMLAGASWGGAPRAVRNANGDTYPLVSTDLSAS